MNIVGVIRFTVTFIFDMLIVLLAFKIAASAKRDGKIIRFISGYRDNSPGHNQNWIYSDVIELHKMPPTLRDTWTYLGSFLSLEVLFSHSTMGTLPLYNEESTGCEKNGG